MTRFTSLAAQLGLASLVITGTIGSLAEPALAQSQAEIAERLNEEGKELMYAEKYAEASAKFREAVARVAEPKYFFNLCTSRYQEGKFSEAVTACNAVEKNNPTPEQSAKAKKMLARIEEEAKAQGYELRPEGGGGGDTNLPPPGDPNAPPDPNNPNPPPPPPTSDPVVGRPPAQGLFAAKSPDNKYTWTLGVDLFGGAGRIGSNRAYGTSTGGVRFKGDYLLDPNSRFGAQGYFQLSHYGQGEMDSALVDTLDIFDVGVAGYKHLCPRRAPRLCLTPLAGVQLALMSPAGETDGYGSQVFNYAALGARVELGLQYGLGRRMEHVLGAQLGLNAYTRVFSGPQDTVSMLSIRDAHLDKGGVAGYFGVGYTYRFDTPLGSSPFITLE